jgi:ATP-binding cassette subfamily F protein 3
VFVSHDRIFTRALADRILAVGGGRVVDWPGTYDEYLAIAGDGDAPGLAHLSDIDARRHGAEQQKSASKADKTESVKLDGEAERDRLKEEKKKKRRIEDLEKSVEKAEAAISKLDEEMAHPGFFDNKVQSAKVMQSRKDLEAEIEKAWKELETLM